MHFKSKKLRLYYEKSDASKLNPAHVDKISSYLDLLSFATEPKDLQIPRTRFHELKGNRKGTYSLRIDGNWRLTFRWSEEGPVDIDYEDYH